MLHTLTESGHMAWKCHGCGNDQMAHISHTDVAHVRYGDGDLNPHVVALPICGDCGTQLFLKTTFTDKELAGISRVDSDGNETSASVDAAYRHMDLAKQLKATGKGPTTTT